MAHLIEQGRLVADTWQTLSLTEDAAAPLPDGPLIVPLALWHARRAELQTRTAPLGLLLTATDRVEDLASDLAQFALIAVAFDRFVDGRGYSTATLLRQRLGYRGPLRAVGDILHDQLFFLQRVGFDSFALRDDKDAATAIASGFNTFSQAYQAATDQPQPYFRRRA